MKIVWCSTAPDRLAYAASIAYRDQAMTAEHPDRPQTKITFKRIVTPDVRPDLYDGYNGELYSPHSLDDLLATMPEHVQRLIEQRQGKPFIDVAQEMVADSWRRALIYYEVDGEVFRLVPGRELEKFNQETGEFKPYDGESIITLKMPMNIENARSFMRAEPKLEDYQR